MADSKENKHWDLGEKKGLIINFSPGKFNLSTGKVLEIGFWKMVEFVYPQVKFLMQLIQMYTHSSA